MFEGLREADTDGVIRVHLLQFENSIFAVRLNVVLMQQNVQNPCLETYLVCARVWGRELICVYPEVAVMPRYNTFGPK